MVIGANSMGSFLFQSLDPSDNSLYVYTPNGTFVQVSNVVLGNTANANSVVVVNAGTLVININGSIGPNGYSLKSNGTAVIWAP